MIRRSLTAIAALMIAWLGWCTRLAPSSVHLHRMSSTMPTTMFTTLRSRRQRRPSAVRLWSPDTSAALDGPPTRAVYHYDDIVLLAPIDNTAAATASSEVVPMFAVQLANDRRYGDLPPQGPAPADYLAGLISRYSDSPMDGGTGDSRSRLGRTARRTAWPWRERAVKPSLYGSASDRPGGAKTG